MNGPKARLVRTFGSAEDVRFWMFRLTRLGIEVNDPDHIRLAENQAAQEARYHQVWSKAKLL